MPRVFVSFRKVDNRWMRDRVYQALAEAFGTSEIFKSGESIPAGGDFAAILRRQAAECQLMLVLIGTAWTDARDADGDRLLDRQDDWVRVEIAAALAAGNRVVPVLLGDAAMLPAPVALPDDIAEIAQLQFLRIPETHMEEGLQRFVTAISGLLPDLPMSSPPIDEPADPAAAALLAGASLTQNTGGGNAVSVQGGMKRSLVAGGDIRETKIHTGGILATLASFLTSKVGMAAAAAATIGIAATIVTTTTSSGHSGTPAPTLASQAHKTTHKTSPPTTNTGVTVGDVMSGFMTIPKGWQACAENDPENAVYPGYDCFAFPGSGDPVEGAALHIEVTGYPDIGECVIHGGSSSGTAVIDVPFDVEAHLQSLTHNDSKVRAVYQTSEGTNAWSVNLCASLPQAKSTEPRDSCFEIVQLSGNTSPMESQEYALWESAKSVRLGSNLSCR